MVDMEDQIEVQVEWAKVTHKNSLKRIHKPSADLAKFTLQIRKVFKELKDVDYLKPDEKISELGNKCRFVLLWHSESPLKQSFLDQSINAI